MVRDDQRDESGSRRHRCPETAPIDPLEHDAEDHGSPADEHRRRIEVRHRRAPLQDDARAELETFRPLHQLHVQFGRGNQDKM